LSNAFSPAFGYPTATPLRSPFLQVSKAGFSLRVDFPAFDRYPHFHDFLWITNLYHIFLL
jgi:hypothetical protein